MKFQTNEKEKSMNVIKKMLKELNDKSTSGIYLREIALLMEEIETLKERLEVRENLLKNYEKELRKYDVLGKNRTLESPGE